VEDAAAAAATLAAGGISFEEEAKRIAVVEGREVWLAICRDSEGNLLGLMSERAAA
jgi:predicted enzyme related to lactoylglutathione lyase